MNRDQADGLRNIHNPVKEPGKMIHNSSFAVISGKGGVGKSVIALNLALSFSGSDKKILLVDADFLKPSLHVLANVSVPFSSEMWIKDKNTPLKKIAFSLNKNVDLITSEGSGFQENLKDWQYTSIIRRILKEGSGYDHIILDFPTGYFPFMNPVLAEIAGFILVTTPEPTSVIDSYALTKLLTRAVSPQKIKVLVNMADDNDEPGKSVENLNRALSHFLSISLDSYPPIPWMAEIKHSVKEQKPIVYENNKIKASFFDTLALSLHS